MSHSNEKTKEGDSGWSALREGKSYKNGVGERSEKYVRRLWVSKAMVIIVHFVHGTIGNH